MTGEHGSPFGVRLRRLRRHRALSQLALAVEIGSTARHVSFIETGRSRPSRQMVLRIGEPLAASLRERNLLLAARNRSAVVDLAAQHLIASHWPRAPWELLHDSLARRSVTT